MPRIRRRRPARLDPKAKSWLCCGNDVSGPYKSWDETFGEGDEGLGAAYDVWQEQGEALIAEFIANYPCRRPAAWWWVNAPSWQHLAPALDSLGFPGIDTGSLIPTPSFSCEPDILEQLGFLSEAELAVLTEWREVDRRLEYGEDIPDPVNPDAEEATTSNARQQPNEDRQGSIDRPRDRWQDVEGPGPGRGAPRRPQALRLEALDARPFGDPNAPPAGIVTGPMGPLPITPPGPHPEPGWATYTKERK